MRLVLSSMSKPSNNFLTDGAKAVLLLWIFFVLCISCLSLSNRLSCSLHSSLVYDVFVCVCHSPIWCPWAGVVLDCIDSLSLPSSLFSNNTYSTYNCHCQTV